MTKLQSQVKSQQLSEIAQAVSAWTNWWHRADSPTMDNVETFHMILTVRGDIAQMNAHMANFFQFDKEEVIGKNFFDLLLPESAKAEFRKTIFTALDNNHFFRGLIPAVANRDQPIFVQWSIQMLKSEEGLPAGSIAIGQDISAQIEQNERAERRANELRIAKKIAESILLLKSEEKTSQLAVKALKAHLGGHTVTLSLIDHAQSQYQILAHAPEIPTQVKIGDCYPLPLNPQSLDGYKKPLPISKPDTVEMLLRSHPHIREREKIKTLLLAPLFIEGDLIGMLTLTFSSEQKFDQETISFVNQVARTIAISIQNGKLREKTALQVEKLARNEAVLLALNKTMLMLSEGKQQFSKILHAFGTMLKTFDLSMAVALKNETSEQLFINYTSIEADTLHAVTKITGFSYDKFPLPAEPLLNREPIFIPPSLVTSIGRSVQQPFMRPEDIEVLSSAVGLSANTVAFLLPLQVQSNTLGSLLLWGAGFTAEQIPLFNTIAKQIAVAMHNRQLMQAEQEAKIKAETVRELSLKLNAQLGQPQLFSEILTHLQRIVHYDSASIMLFENDKLMIAAREGSESGYDALIPIDVQDLPGIQKIIKTLKPLLIQDTAQAENWLNLPALQQVRSWIGIPLLPSGQLIGVLNLNSTKPNFFTPADLDWAHAFTSQAALTIANARLISEVQNHADNLEIKIEKRTKALSLLYEIVVVVGDYQNLAKNLKKISQKIQQHLGTEGFAIYRHPFLSPDNRDQWELLHQSGTFPADFLKNQAEIIEQMLQKAVDHLSANHRHHSLRWQEKFDQRNLWFHPIQTRGQIFGLMLFNSPEFFQFNEEDSNLIFALGEHLATAFENSFLYDQAKLSAAERERRRLANNLHDSVTQSLYSLGLFAQAAQERMKNRDYGPAGVYVSEMKSTALQALKEMRLLLYELRADSFLENGLITALQHRLDAVERRASIDAILIAEEIDSLPREIVENLYYIAIEGLNNTLKHASANQIVVELRQANDHVVMTLLDNGSGFEHAQADRNAGMGLTIIKERVSKFAGTFNIQTTPQKGTKLEICIPVQVTNEAGV
jgi:PAS domain S-box-containing protein